MSKFQLGDIVLVDGEMAKVIEVDTSRHFPYRAEFLDARTVLLYESEMTSYIPGSQESRNTSTPVDSLISEYALRMREIYEKRTAGDYSFTGLITELLASYKSLFDDAPVYEAPHSRACTWTDHPHGMRCSSNCPTCHGKEKV